MKGAIIGDIVGSIYEGHNIKTKDFPLFQNRCRYTDDTVMTCAVAKAFMDAEKDDIPIVKHMTRSMQALGRRNPHRGYGGRFGHWIYAEDPQPYYSFGNGAAMRASPAGFLGKTVEESYQLGELTAMPTHNHPEGLRAAGITAALVWLARHGADREALYDYVSDKYIIPRLDVIRPTYRFDVTCMGTMPVAIAALLESASFEDAIRNAISVGGDSDTIAAITGSIAEAFYGVPEEIWQEARSRLTPELAEIVDEFYTHEWLETSTQ